MRLLVFLYCYGINFPTTSSFFYLIQIFFPRLIFIVKHANLFEKKMFFYDPNFLDGFLVHNKKKYFFFYFYLFFLFIVKRSLDIKKCQIYVDKQIISFIFPYLREIIKNENQKNFFLLLHNQHSS